MFMLYLSRHFSRYSFLLFFPASITTFIVVVAAVGEMLFPVIVGNVSTHQQSENKYQNLLCLQKDFLRLTLSCCQEFKGIANEKKKNKRKVMVL